MTDRNDLVWRGIGQIGDDLVEQAEESRVRECFASWRRRKRMCSAFAACLVLGFGLILALRLPFAPKNGAESMGNNAEWNHSSDTTEISPAGNPPIRISSPEPSDPQCESNPWEIMLKYNVCLEKSGYAPDEIPVIELTFGLVDDFPGQGCLKVLVDVGNFTEPMETEWIFDSYLCSDHPVGSDRLTIPLIRDENTASGTVTISFWVYPSEDSDADISKEGLRIGWVGLSYTCDEQGITFIPLYPVLPGE